MITKPVRTLLQLCLAAACCQAQETLSLDQAVSMALDQNRNLRSSSLDVEKAKEKVLAGRTRLLPSFSVYVLGAQQLRSFELTIEKGVLGNYPGTGPLPAEDVHLKSPLAPT